VKAVIVLDHAGLTPSGMGTESYVVKRHPKSTDGGMLSLTLREPEKRGEVHVTLDAVTAANLGAALQVVADAYLDEHAHREER
jgi:hypothetical protein